MSTSNRNNKKQKKMNKLVYLGLPILEISKTVIYQIWYGYIKPRYNDKANPCYVDTDSSIVYNKN